MKLIVHTDGGSRGNPGKGACAFVVEANNENGAVINRGIRGKYLGVCTNNEAEYEAVLEALKQIRISNIEYRKIGKIDEIIIKSDSLLVVSQLSGKWKIKDRELQQKVIEVKKLEMEAGAPVRYQHIPRELNKEADREVNRILDVN